MMRKHQNTKTRARKIEGMAKIKAAYLKAKAEGKVRAYKIIPLSQPPI